MTVPAGSSLRRFMMADRSTIASGTMSEEASAQVVDREAGHRDLGVAFRNALKLGGSLLGTWAVALVVRFQLPRLMGPERFGAFNFADSASVVVFTFLGFGVDTYIQKEIAVRPEHASDFFGAVVVLRAAAGVLLLGGFLAFLHLTGRGGEILEAGSGLRAGADLRPPERVAGRAAAGGHQGRQARVGQRGDQAAVGRRAAGRAAPARADVAFGAAGADLRGDEDGAAGVDGAPGARAAAAGALAGAARDAASEPSLLRQHHRLHRRRATGRHDDGIPGPEQGGRLVQRGELAVAAGAPGGRRS